MVPLPQHGVQTRSYWHGMRKPQKQNVVSSVNVYHPTVQRLTGVFFMCIVLSSRRVHRSGPDFPFQSRCAMWRPFITVKLEGNRLQINVATLFC